MILPVKRPAWIVLGCALLVHILMLSLQANGRPGPGFLRLALLDGLSPMEKLADGGIHGVWNIWDGYIALVGVRDENIGLREEISRLQMEMGRREEALREAERLRAFWGLSESGLGKVIAARVIGRDPSLSLRSVTIDRGLAHGVRKNASVIVPEGVVGRVVGVGSSSAVVQLLTDAQSEIGVTLSETRVQAVFKGTGGRDLELDYIDNDNEIAEGNELLSSGLDRIHPKGLPVAMVTSVGPRRGLFKVVLARPRANLGRLENVLVVIELAEPAAEEPAISAPPVPSD